MAGDKLKTWNFAKLESGLANWHTIHGSKRTAFQARLKNFLRLGFPPDTESTKGKPTEFSAWSAYQLAVALEMTQLGMPPERAIKVLIPNSYAMAMAAQMAAEAVHGMIAGKTSRSDMLRMFLYFDPEALDSLTVDQDEDFSQAERTFFYGGHGVLADMLRNLDNINDRRLAIVNVTSLVEGLTGALGAQFIGQLIEQADAKSRESEGND